MKKKFRWKFSESSHHTSKREKNSPQITEKSLKIRGNFQVYDCWHVVYNLQIYKVNIYINKTMMKIYIQFTSGMGEKG